MLNPLRLQESLEGARCKLGFTMFREVSSGIP